MTDLRIAFRADASADIGSGHVMRCLTLADELRARGSEAEFLCVDAAGHLGDLISQRGYRVHWLSATGSSAEDATACRDVLAGRDIQWVVVDHYRLDLTWERELRAVCKRILVIDDLADRFHDCDLLLDQNHFSAAGARYGGRIPDKCRALLGPRYALLRPAFREARRKTGDRGGPVQRILVFLGGADPQDATAIVLRALDAFPALEIDVVLGRNHPGAADHGAWCARRPGAILRQPSDGFAELMAASDLVIGAGGATTWERCCLGLPSVVVGIASNQYAVAQAAGEEGAHMYLGPADRVAVDEIAAAIRCLVASSSLRIALATAGRALVDGLGARRVAEAMVPDARVSVRPALAGDAEMLFRWRDDPVTRRHFFDPAPIPLHRHLEWFALSLADTNRILLVGEDRRGPLGVIRFDLHGEEAEVSVYLAPERRGHGLGAALIARGTNWMLDRYKAIKRLTARVLPENVASARAFGDAGYTEICRNYVLEP